MCVFYIILATIMCAVVLFLSRLNTNKTYFLLTTSPDKTSHHHDSTSQYLHIDGDCPLPVALVPSDSDNVGPSNTKCKKRKHHDIGIGNNCNKSSNTSSTIDIANHAPSPVLDAAASTSPGIVHDHCDLQKEQKGDAERSALQKNEVTSTYDCCSGPFDCDNHAAWYHQAQAQAQAQTQAHEAQAQGQTQRQIGDEQALRPRSQGQGCGKYWTQISKYRDKYRSYLIYEGPQVLLINPLSNRACIFYFFLNCIRMYF